MTEIVIPVVVVSWQLTVTLTRRTNQTTVSRPRQLVKFPYSVIKKPPSAANMPPSTGGGSSFLYFLFLPAFPDKMLYL